MSFHKNKIHPAGKSKARGIIGQGEWMKRKVIIFITLFFTISAGLCAVTGTAGGAAAFLRSGVGARALSLGGAFTADTDDSTVAYWNPAGISSFKALGISTMYSWLTADRQNSFLNVVCPTQAGIFALNIISSSVGDIEQRSSDTPNYTLFSYDDNVYFLTYANRIYKNISYGANMKVLRTTVGAAGAAASATGISFDLGADIQFSDCIGFGLVFQDAAARYLWSTGTNENIPFLMRMGFMGKFLDGGLNLLFDAEENEFEGMDFKGGIEGTFMKILSLRTGASYSASGDYINFTFGGGIKYSISGVLFQLDYAMLPQNLGVAETGHKLSFNVYFDM
jgi:hypothetical protein